MRKGAPRIITSGGGDSPTWGAGPVSFGASSFGRASGINSQIARMGCFSLADMLRMLQHRLLGHHSLIQENLVLPIQLGPPPFHTGVLTRGVLHVWERTVQRALDLWELLHQRKPVAGSWTGGTPQGIIAWGIEGTR